MGLLFFLTACDVSAYQATEHETSSFEASLSFVTAKSSDEALRQVHPETGSICSVTQASLIGLFSKSDEQKSYFVMCEGQSSRPRSFTDR